MNRRSFLFRASAATAIAILNPAELLEQLAPKRLLFPSVDLYRAPSELYYGYTTVAELSRLYRRSTTKLYRQYANVALL